MKKLTLKAALFLSVLSVYSCSNPSGKAGAEAAAGGDAATEQTGGVTEAENQRKAAIEEEYPKVPIDEVFNDAGGAANNPLYDELKSRYKETFIALKKEIEASGAKMVTVILTPEVGSGKSQSNKFGIPFLISLAQEQGVPVFDLSPALAKKDAKFLTQVPFDGHWSKDGAKYIAEQIAPVLKQYAGYKSTVTFPEDKRPATFGDLDPNYDQVLDGGKNLPYHVTANAQGIRMKGDLTFPKTKQRILMLGDSEFFCPFLDDENTISTFLQQMLPNTEVLNSGIIGYCIDDSYTLFKEKAKYSEPDIVLVEMNGGDILDLYFTARNHFSRTKKPYEPTKLEKEFYKKYYTAVK